MDSEKQKEKQRKANHKHYDKNREKLIANLCKKVTCECGKETALANLSRHRKNSLHRKKMEKLKDL
jgi:hypothetical protein